jgi:hypothetical protein
VTPRIAPARMKNHLVPCVWKLCVVVIRDCLVDKNKEYYIPPKGTDIEGISEGAKE